MKRLFFSLMLVMPLFFTGCKTTDPKTQDFLMATVPYIESGACLAATIVIDYGISESDKVVKCKTLWGITRCLYSLTNGDIPTPAEFQKAIESFTPSDGIVWYNLVRSLGNIYRTEFNKINGNPKNVFIIINAIASGVSIAASQYVPPSTSD